MFIVKEIEGTTKSSGEAILKTLKKQRNLDKVWL
jgi:hypothetical protein